MSIITYISASFFLTQNIEADGYFSEKKLTSLISHQYTSSSRYSWKGYEKTLLYFIDKKSLFYCNISFLCQKKLILQISIEKDKYLQKE